jgi:hypothetical protein
MSGFVDFVRLGFHHITAPGALDHLLFLLALVAPYRLRDWRHLAGVATAFTVGHSITLALVVTHMVTLPTSLIEFLIPVTIVGAAIENFRRPGQVPGGWVRPVLAAGFGLIHGAGFANFLREMFVGPPAGPLLAFNLGIEAGQLAILAIALVSLTGLDRGLGLVAPSVPRAVRLRRLAASAIAASWALVIAFQRAPW